ncbi:hypothetical protein [Streptomyces sp. 11x1]|uniref:hypothetical protein n=1 Tax=Streptomyces sp. 11x1 TaxID=3038642 RepID=UPI0029302A6A|nr:hypothetical protein [Streptomyces sp. 11x1]WNZ09963.1 hypothetical protein P8T65_21770 [Streptomyces sp. 11x1]
MTAEGARSAQSHRNRSSKRKLTLRLVLVGAAVTGAATLPSAYAALVPEPPSAVLDLSTSESFDTGALMAKLCPAPRKVDYWTDVTHWFYNPATGEVGEDPTKGAGDAQPIDGLIHQLEGHCEFPVTDVKDEIGKAQVVSRPLVNCGDEVTLRESVTQDFTTSETYTTSVSVGGGFDLAVIKDVLSLSGNASVTQSWAFGKSKSISRAVTIDVPARTKGYFERVPVIRTVVSQPVFVIEKIARIDQDGETGISGWNDTGNKRITSPAFQTSSSADVLDANEFPSGTIRAQDDPVTAEDCD